MKNGIAYEDKILVAGGSGLAGSAILRSLKKAGYGKKELGGELFYPTRNELDYLSQENVKKWFKENIRVVWG